MHLQSLYIMLFHTTVCLPCPEPVQSSPILSSESIVPRSGISQTSASSPRSLLSNPDTLSDQPNKPVTNTGVLFNILANCVFGPKNFEIPVIKM
jgi:hypothetical protein